MTSGALDTTVFWPNCLCFHLSYFHLSWSSLPKLWVFTPSQSECSWRILKTSPGSSRATALCRTLTLSITTAIWLLSGRSFRRPLEFHISSRVGLSFPPISVLSVGRLARGREEWDSALLQNANTKCNGLLPVWGPHVPESAFATCLAR